MHTVSEVAALASTTVRTLHHYDRLGLLRPSARSETGYRLYDHDDLVQLQRIMAWRELGFPLADIPGLMAGEDVLASLVAQRRVLEERVQNLGEVLRRLDDTIAEMTEAHEMDESRMFEGFDATAYEAEAEERWGDTDAWQQSRQRVGAMTPEQMGEVQREGQEHARRMAAAMKEGVQPSSAEAMDLAEESRLHIGRHFYDCPREMHVALGEMYVSDPRFAAHYDAHAEGLAVWLHEAIIANAAR